MTWNCATALAKKLDRLVALSVDIAVVQECSRVDAAAEGALFLGPPDPRARKGVALLAINPEFKLVEAAQRTPEYWWLLPAEVHGPEEFNILAVWAYGHRRQPSGLRLHEVLDKWKPFIESRPTVVVGDFNNSVQWDTVRRPDHRRTVDALAELGLISAYHERFGTTQGHEAHPTLMWRWNPARPYHIDYMFIPAAWRSRLSAVEVGEASDWLRSSDHMPVVATFTEA